MRAGGVFVAGTGTDVGKTVASACLVRALDADYWKPVQSGAAQADDTETVVRLAGLSADRVHPPACRFAAPLSPDQAAALEGIAIDPGRIVPPPTGRVLVVEGAGGLLVPLTPRFLMVDLVVRLGLPVVLVGHSGLGTINHTLLSLEALRARAVPVLGVLLSGERHPDNREAIECHGGVPVKELPWADPLDAAAVERLAADLWPGSRPLDIGKGWW
ncbi:MAG: dethiobiotin synthase [Alphaproteobacteria bacterium]